VIAQENIVPIPVLPATEEAIAQGAAALRRGALVAFPTETVYGLGADADNLAALRALFAAKGRPADHPVIVHLAAAEQIALWARDIPPAAWKLAEAHWPGPLTLILRRSNRVNDLVTGGQDTVGLRVPGHPVALALLQQFGGVAAPSANRFGHVSPTRAQHVADEGFPSLELILDGGSCRVGLESTIVDLSRDRPTILRPGAVTAEQLAPLLATTACTPASPAPRVSGGLASHYAPRARVELLAAESLAARAAELVQAGSKVALVIQTAIDLPVGVLPILVGPGEETFARELYAALREADGTGCDVILVPQPAGEGLSAAIADRLKKAAAPR
jgi:L-threonylcarbamoyladenylate synthase